MRQPHHKLSPQAISKECLGLMVLVPGISSRKASISATINHMKQPQNLRPKLAIQDHVAMEKLSVCVIV